MNKSEKIQWLAEPEEKDYPAAQSYLNLLYDDQQTRRLIAALKAAPVRQFKAKGLSNFHIEKDRAKIRAARSLSPILMVRDATNRWVVIADGYHRLCAVYSFDEDASIPSKIV